MRKRHKFSNINRRLTVLLVFSVLALLITAVFANFPPKKSALKGLVQSATTTKEVPELAEILSSDQTTRLKATRKLAERVGVEEALEIVQNSKLPHTGEGHLAVHQIGFYAYQIYGKDAVLHCKDYFLYACYHGAIIEAATDQGFPIIKEMTDRCKEQSARHFQCVHAAGHSILAIWNYDLRSALKTCDELYESETQFPTSLSSCHNGSFMENLFGVHDWGTENSPKAEWLKDDDPFFPCNAFGEKYQRGCWLNQAARIYQMNSGDLKKTASVCETVPNEEYRAWCFDNLGRQIHPLTEGDVSKVFSLCQSVGPFWYTNCVIVNAGAFFTVGDPNTAVAVCNAINGFDKRPCYAKIIEFSTGYGLTIQEKKGLCQKMDANYEKECFSQIGLI